MPLERLGEFFTAAREHLDAVVLERIVRGADHDPRVEAHRARHIGDGGRRDHAGGRDRGSFGVHAPPELAFDPLAGFAGVAADEESGADVPPRSLATRPASAWPGPGRRPAAQPFRDRADNRRPCPERHQCQKDGPCCMTSAKGVKVLRGTAGAGGGFNGAQVRQVLGARCVHHRLNRRTVQARSRWRRSFRPGRPESEDCTGPVRGRQGPRRRERRPAESAIKGSRAPRTVTRTTDGVTLRPQIGAKISPPHRHGLSSRSTGAGAISDDHRRRLRLHEPNRRVGDRRWSGRRARALARRRPTPARSWPP